MGDLAELDALPEDSPLLHAIERFTRVRVPEGQVPRGDAAFQASVEVSVAHQRDPGPRQPGHGLSSRPAGQQPGRHARTHGHARGAAHRRAAGGSRWQ